MCFSSSPQKCFILEKTESTRQAIKMLCFWHEISLYNGIEWYVESFLQTNLPPQKHTVGLGRFLLPQGKLRNITGSYLPSKVNKSQAEALREADT